MPKPRARFSPEYELLLARLIEARKAAGVTQSQIADALGKPQSHVSKCESQEREISIIDLRFWCSVLGTTTSDFVRDWELAIEESKALNLKHEKAAA